jgi:hypothetical protein
MFEPRGFQTPGRPVFGRSAQAEEAAAAPPALRGKALARHQARARAAAELLTELPAPGHAVHVLMTGLFDLAQVVCRICRDVKPRALRIATLAWNRRNILDLAAMLEPRPFPVLLLGSEFHREHNKALVEWAVAELAPFGSRIVAARNHCKVVALDLADDDALVLEGIANLRTNGNWEQLAAIRDRELHDWHAGWIDELARKDGNRGQEEAAGKEETALGRGPQGHRGRHRPAG